MAIIFIPGIKATALANVNTFDFELIYENYNSFPQAVGSNIMGVRLSEQLQINPKYDLSTQNIIERNHIMSFPYKNSIKDIRDSVPEDIYMFGYDWRKSNADNAILLADYINYLSEKLEKTSFSFITHSMGALVLGCYLKNLNGNYSVVNKIAFTAPPFKGGMEALRHLAVGDGGIRGFLECDEGSRKAMRTYPAIYELCPWYYAAVKNSDNQPVDLSSIDHWQNSIYNDLPKIFPQRMESMINFRNNQMLDLNELPETIREKCIVVAGTGSNTLLQVNLVDDPGNKKHYNFKEAISTEEGDNTVPLASSTVYKDVIKTITVEKSSIFRERSSLSYHALFLSDSRVVNIVKRFLNDGYSKTDPNWYKSIGNESEIKLL